MSLVQPGRVFAPQQLPVLFAAVAAVQLLVVLAAAISSPAMAEEAPVTAPGEPAGEPALVTFPAALRTRLPPDIARDILALETEDHYLRVHAAAGSALILMRMADAVALLDPRLGMQVHRRWWVAQAGVRELTRDGQSLSLRLADGKTVPVGRTFAAAVRARFAYTTMSRLTNSR